MKVAGVFADNVGGGFIGGLFGFAITEGEAVRGAGFRAEDVEAPGLRHAVVGRVGGSADDGFELGSGGGTVGEGADGAAGGDGGGEVHFFGAFECEFITAAANS